MLERSWHRKATALAVETSADIQLSRSVEQVQRKLKIGEENLSALRQHLATAHIVHGAVYSAKARRQPAAGAPSSHTALMYYRAALSVPEHENSLIAKENVAHELLRLGLFEEALVAYRELEEIAPRSNDIRTRHMMIARAKCFQALLLQARNSSLQPDGERLFTGSLAAYNTASEAQSIRAKFSPYQDFDQLEQGDLHYLSAFIARNNEFSGIEPVQLVKAENCYSSVVHSRTSVWRDRSKSRALKALAREGLQRVSDAKLERKYDWRWLLTN